MSEVLTGTVLKGSGGQLDGFAAFDVFARLGSDFVAEGPGFLGTFTAQTAAGLNPTVIATEISNLIDDLAERADAEGLGVHVSDTDGVRDNDDTDNNGEISGQDRLLLKTGDGEYISGGVFDVSLFYGDEGPSGEHGRYRLVQLDAAGNVVASSAWQNFYAAAVNDENFAGGGNPGLGRFTIDSSLTHTGLFNAIEFSGALNEAGAALATGSSDVADYLLTGLKLSTFERITADDSNDFAGFNVVVRLANDGGRAVVGSDNVNTDYFAALADPVGAPTGIVDQDLLFGPSRALLGQASIDAAGLGAHEQDGDGRSTPGPFGAGGDFDGNPEIQGNDSLIFITDGLRQLRGGTFEVSLLYAEEGNQADDPGPAPEPEQGQYRLLQVDVDGNVIAASEFFTFQAAGNGAFSSSNPGLQTFTLDIGANDKFYNAIEFTGALNAAGTAARQNNAGDVNDFIVTEVSVDVLDQIKGWGGSAEGYADFRVYARLGAVGDTAADSTDLGTYNLNFDNGVSVDNAASKADGATVLASDVLERLNDVAPRTILGEDGTARELAEGLGVQYTDGDNRRIGGDNLQNAEIQGEDRLLFVTDGAIKGGYFEASLFYEDDRAGRVDDTEQGRYRLVFVNEETGVIEFSSDWITFTADNEAGDTTFAGGKNPGLDQISIDSALIAEATARGYTFNGIEFSGAINEDGTAAGSTGRGGFDVFDFLISELTLNVVRDSEAVFEDHLSDGLV